MKSLLFKEYDISMKKKTKMQIVYCTKNWELKKYIKKIHILIMPIMIFHMKKNNAQRAQKGKGSNLKHRDIKLY